MDRLISQIQKYIRIKEINKMASFMDTVIIYVEHILGIYKYPIAINMSN